MPANAERFGCGPWTAGRRACAPPWPRPLPVRCDISAVGGARAGLTRLMKEKRAASLQPAESSAWSCLLEELRCSLPGGTLANPVGGSTRNPGYPTFSRHFQQEASTVTPRMNGSPVDRHTAWHEVAGFLKKPSTASRCDAPLGGRKTGFRPNQPKPGMGPESRHLRLGHKDNQAAQLRAMPRDLNQVWNTATSSRPRCSREGRFIGAHEMHFDRTVPR